MISICDKRYAQFAINKEFVKITFILVFGCAAPSQSISMSTVARTLLQNVHMLMMPKPL